MQRITYRGHTLTWEEHSPGDHTFIFIHGYSGNRAMWHYDIQRLRDLGRCVTLDLPGHYPATPPDRYTTLTQGELLDIEAHAVKTICGDGKATLIGHSTGGLVALGVAALLPETVSRVVSIAGVVWGPLTGVLRPMQWVVRMGWMPIYTFAYSTTRFSAEGLMRGVASAYVYDGDALLKNEDAWARCRHWFPDYRQSSLEHVAVLLSTLETCDIRPLIDGMQTPALVITGSHDPVVPPQQSRWVFTHLPNAQFEVLERVGHIVQWEASERMHQTIRRWLHHTEHPT